MDLLDMLSASDIRGTRLGATRVGPSGNVAYVRSDLPAIAEPHQSMDDSAPAPQARPVPPSTSRQVIARSDAPSGSGSRRRTREEAMLDENMGRFLYAPSTGGHFVNSTNITQTSPRSQWSMLKRAYVYADNADAMDNEVANQLIQRSSRAPHRPAPDASTSHHQSGEVSVSVPSPTPPARNDESAHQLEGGTYPELALEGPRYEGNYSGIHPKFLGMLMPSSEDSVAQIEYLQSTTSTPVLAQLRNFSDKAVERAKMQLAYLSHNVDVESHLRFQQREDLHKRIKDHRDSLMKEIEVMKAEIHAAEEKARLANEASKTAEAKLLEIASVRTELETIKSNLAEAQSGREQDQQARRRAEEDYEKLRRAIPTIFAKGLNSAEVKAPFRRFATSSKEVGSIEMVSALSSAGVQIPSPLPPAAQALVKEDSYENRKRAGEALKDVKSHLIEEIGGDAHVPIDRILGMLS